MLCTNQTYNLSPSDNLLHHCATCTSQIHEALIYYIVVYKSAKWLGERESPTSRWLIPAYRSNNSLLSWIIEMIYCLSAKPFHSCIRWSVWMFDNGTMRNSMGLEAVQLDVNLNSKDPVRTQAMVDSRYLVIIKKTIHSLSWIIIRVQWLKATLISNLFRRYWKYSLCSSVFFFF